MPETNPHLEQYSLTNTAETEHLSDAESTTETHANPISEPEQLEQTHAELDSSINAKSETELKLSETRAALGLPDSETAPHSVQMTEKRIGSLEERAADLEDSVENIRLTEAKERAPKLTLISQLTKEGLITKPAESTSMDVSPTEETDKIAKYIEEYDGFKLADEKLAQQGEQTQLPEDAEVTNQANEKLSEIRSLYAELGFVSKQEQAGPAINLAINYEPESINSQYINHEVHSMFYGKDSPIADSIVVGGKNIQKQATMLRNAAEQVGITLNEQESINVAMTYIIGHEYGHHTERSGGDALSNRAMENVPINFSVDDSDKQGIISENFADSLGREIMKAKMTKMGYPEAQTDQLLNSLYEDESKVKELFDELDKTAKDKGLSVADIHSSISRTTYILRKSGEADKAHQLSFSPRSLGYVLPKLNSKQLKEIIRGERG